MTISLQTLMPSVVTPNTQILVTDIDGDGKNEVIMLDSNLKQLSICHQFTYSQFSLSNITGMSSSSTTPLWPNSTAQNWMTTWGVPIGGIPVQQGATCSAWQVEFGDVIMAGDFDGDGTDELFIYNLTSLNWGVLKWQSTGLQTICNQSASPVIQGPIEPVTWQGSVNDQYFVVPNLSGILPNVTANSAGILLYNSQTFAMGMLSYSAGSFTQCWSNTGTTLPGWNLAAKGSQPATNKFYPGYFVAAGVPTIVVYNPSDAYIGLMVWNSQNSQFEVQSGKGHQVGNFSFGWTDQLQAADLDGDGLDEIFIFSAGSGGTGDIGILKLVSGSFQQLALSGGTFGNQPNQWTTNQQDTYLCLSSSGGGVPGKIYCYSPGIPGNSSQVPEVGMLYYSNNAFSVAWSGSSLLPNNGWPVTAADSIYAGPARNSAIPNLITLSNQGPASAPVLTLGGAGWTGQTPSASGQVQLVSSEKVPIASWSPGGMASNAPHTPFTPFTGNQQQIYTYISQLFPIPGVTNPNAPTDVRSLYSSIGDSGKWENYANDLAPINSLSKIPSNWPALPAGNTWTDSDWQPVQGTICNEANQVDTVYSMYAEIATLATDFNVFQKGDLKTVALNIKQAAQVNPESSVHYWEGQIFVAILCGIAASAALFFPPAATLAAASFGIFFSTVASLASSGLGYNPTQLKSYAIKEVEKKILDTLRSSIVTNSLNLTGILTDPVKMTILDGLHDTAWELDTSFPSVIEQPFELVDRLLMYQQLIPFFFSIQVYEPGAFPPHTPTYPPNPSSNSVTYLLNDQSGYVSASQFSGTALYADLFTTIGASQEDFFAGNGGWSNIQRTTIPAQAALAQEAAGD